MKGKARSNDASFVWLCNINWKKEEKRLIFAMLENVVSKKKVSELLSIVNRVQTKSKTD